ncbi:hypothetical protein KGP40_00225 [Weissella cibaria]|uniref:hypothetical protein n=1 Tax=Weissella cibaria TaxID=137591 RepID=UPI001C1FE0C2|nr:hypothetical protein [Weissella cibaria]MBU7560342.1 hypothetical protein [Weissella cibaria]
MGSTMKLSTKSKKAAIFGGLTTLIALILSALFPKVSITILVIWLIVFIIGVSKISNSTPKN